MRSIVTKVILLLEQTCKIWALFSDSILFEQIRSTRKNKNVFGSKSKGIEFIHFLMPYKKYPSSIPVGRVWFLKKFDSNKKTLYF